MQQKQQVKFQQIRCGIIRHGRGEMSMITKLDITKFSYSSVCILVKMNLPLFVS